MAGDDVEQVAELGVVALRDGTSRLLRSVSMNVVERPMPP
jgi:hypothetical protein